MFQEQTKSRKLIHASKNHSHHLIQDRAFHTSLLRLHIKQTASPYLCNLNISETFNHVIWDCPEVYDFWRKVALTLSDITGKPLPLEPLPVA